MQRNLSASYWDRVVPIVLIVAGAGTATLGLAADLLTIGGLPGIGPNQVSLALSGFAVLVTGLVLISPARRRYIAEWLLVGLAALVVAFAADLLLINGLPEFGAKHIVLAATGLGVLLTVVVPTSAVDRRNLGEWLNPLVLDKLQLGKFLSVTVQLGLLVLVVRQLELENQALYSNIMLLTFYGFIIHYFLPSAYRLAFFLFLSLAAIVGILGLVNGAWLIAIGLGLIGICHLPVPHSARVGLLLVAGAVLVALRVDWLPADWLAVIWPVLASMFMFRLIIYVYDLRHGKAKPTFASTLSYFFLLPNVVFPFFPIVDYSTFRRTYYDDDQHRIYQTGLQWMLRGVIQLILYRYVNYYLALAPQDVTNASELVRYLISNFALYIRISGQFHLIIGLLHLFGFNLPETHHLYFMAASFTDLWRRINIYWKDFMLKVFYYPTYFRIRHWGPTTSLLVATGVVFFLTWFFHAYQWFWLRGTFLLTPPDMLFWFILAVLVMANTLNEAKRGRKRTLGQQAGSLGDVAAQALGSAATFSLMAVLWSLWSSESIRDWLALLSVAQLNVPSAAVLLLSFLGVAVVFGLTIWLQARVGKSAGAKAKPSAYFRSAAVTGGALLLLYLVSNPLVYGRLGGRAEELIGDLATNRLSDQEAALLQQGYYEDLIGVNRFNSQLWDIYMKRPSDWPSIMETEAVRRTGDNFLVELVPSTSFVFHGAQMSINHWGMRDQEYEQTPAPGTYRVALTGPSFVMGSGVADHEVFEWRLEDRLNQEHAGGRYARYEILNFAVPGYSPLQDLLVLEEKALPFQPNALFYMAHQRDAEQAALYLADRFSVGASLPYDDLMALASEAGAETGATVEENERRLKPLHDEVILWTYRRIVAVSQAHAILPVWIFMPTLEDPLQAETVSHLSQLAQEAGFVVVDLSDAYEGQSVASLVVADWDKHPNARGHALIGARLYQALSEKADEIPLFP